MTEYSGYWGGTTIGDAAVSAPYTDDFFSDLWSLLFTYDRTTQGVINTLTTAYSSLLAITAPGGGLVRVANGAAIVDGKAYYNTANVDNAVATPVAPNTNYYRLVLRKTFATQIVRIALLGPSTVATPALTQTDGTTWEISLATITVAHTTGAITITDTRQYAPEIQEDNLGDGVPFLYQRQGGLTADWMTEGANNYAPGNVRIMVGSSDPSFPGGTQYGTGSITFPTPFSKIPIVLASFNAPTAEWGSDAIVVNTNAVTVSGCTFKLESADGGNIPVGTFGAIQWMAIGEK